MDEQQTNGSGEEAGLFESLAAATANQQQETESKDETQTPATPATPAAATPAATPEAAAAEGDPAAAAAAAQPAWTPNYKVKAFKKEYEIPEMYRALAKDPETEKQLKEVFTKYHSFDDTRAMYDHTRKERDEMAQRYAPIESQLGKAASIYSEAVKPGGNIHSLDQAFEILGLQPEHIMQYAVEKAKLEQMDPAQRSLVEGKLLAERQAQEFREQQQSLGGQLAQQRIELKQQEYQMVMAQPQVTQLADAFKEKFGMEFDDEVVAAGEAAWTREGKNISVAEAVQRVAKRYNLEGGQASGNVQAAAATPANQGQVQARIPVKPLPNIKANNGSSPVGKPKVADLDDLKKLRDQAFTS